MALDWALLPLLRRNASARDPIEFGCFLRRFFPLRTPTLKRLGLDGWDAGAGSEPFSRPWTRRVAMFSARRASGMLAVWKNSRTSSGVGMTLTPATIIDQSCGIKQALKK